MVARHEPAARSRTRRLLFGSERRFAGGRSGPASRTLRTTAVSIAGLDCRPADVDHFIPWSRYPDDGLDNLVAAHPKCNNSKRDFLAAAEHVEHWMERIREHDSDLAGLARDCGWPRDLQRSTSVARAVYLGLPLSTRLWRGLGAFDPVDHARITRALAPVAQQR